MRKATITLVLTMVAVAISAAQKPDRSAPPKPGSAPSFAPPPVQKRTLTNGLPVWIVELHRAPVAHVTLVVRSGSAADPQQKPGVASMTARMLDEGAGTRDALEIADAVDYLGASLATSSSFDASSIDLHLPVARLGDGLSIMADVAERPTFPDNELQRLREELLTSFIEAQDDPAALIGLAFPRLVFGAKHRYGTPAMGTPAAVKALTVTDLRQFHARHYTSANSLLIVAGDVTPSRAMPLLEKTFGGWRGAAPAVATIETAPQLTARQVFLIDKPGAPQSQIRIGWVGVPRSTPDYYAIRVLNTVLGGAFTSRLNQNLRETHGYTYGANSSFDMRTAAGPFFAAAGVQTDKTAESLVEFFKELEAIRKPIPSDELEKAKSYLTLQNPRAFETTGAIASSLSQIFVYGLPENYYATFTDRIRAITPADVQRVAEKYIQPDKFAIVVIGDRKTIEPKIAALKLGTVKVVNVDAVLQ